jgi:hypothetical protein
MELSGQLHATAAIFPEKVHGTHWIEGLSGSQRLSRRCGEEKNLHCQESNPGRPARSCTEKITKCFAGCSYVFQKHNRRSRCKGPAPAPYINALNNSSGLCEPIQTGSLPRVWETMSEGIILPELDLCSPHNLAKLFPGFRNGKYFPVDHNGNETSKMAQSGTRTHEPRTRAGTRPLRPAVTWQCGAILLCIWEGQSLDPG